MFLKIEFSDIICDFLTVCKQQSCQKKVMKSQFWVVSSGKMLIVKRPRKTLTREKVDDQSLCSSRFSGLIMIHDASLCMKGSLESQSGFEIKGFRKKVRAHNHFLAWLCSKVKVEMGHIHYIESGGSAQLSSTVFENQQKKSHFSKNSSKLTVFGIFNELLSTQNVQVAHFARNVQRLFL